MFNISLVDMIHEYANALQKDSNLGRRQYLMSWIICRLRKNRLEIGRDSFYIGTTLFSEKDDDIASTAKTKHIANQILSSVIIAEDKMISEIEIWDTATDLLVQYSVARDEGLDEEQTEEYIDTWLLHSFEVEDKKYCQFGLTLFSPDDLEDVRFVQKLSTGIFMKKAYSNYKDGKKKSYVEILNEVEKELVNFI